MQEHMLRIKKRNFYIFEHLWKAFEIVSFNGRRVKDEITKHELKKSHKITLETLVRMLLEREF